MSYSNGPIITYSYPAVNFGAGTTGHAFKAPKGYTQGTIIDIGVAVTTLFTNTTTPAYVRVGTAGDPDAYAELNMGVAAATDYYGTLDDTDAIINAKIPSTTQVEVACIAPTGGTPAGIGTVHITVRWF